MRFDDNKTGLSVERTREQRGRETLQASRNLPHFEDLDLIADFYIGVVLNPDTTLETIANFVRVVFKAAERLELSLVDDHIVAQDSDWLGAINGAFDHHTAGNLAPTYRPAPV